MQTANIRRLKIGPNCSGARKGVKTFVFLDASNKIIGNIKITLGFFGWHKNITAQAGQSDGGHKFSSFKKAQNWVFDLQRA
jgi:hypothetical protein